MNGRKPLRKDDHGAVEVFAELLDFSIVVRLRTGLASHYLELVALALGF